MKIQKVIEVVPYNPNWPRSYQEEAKKIEGTLGRNCITIHHIGSTAVPGLTAKPIIDIMIVVRDILEVDKALTAFEELGYIAKGEHGIPFRRYFQKGTDLHTHHIHIYEEGSPDIERLLHFRDYLTTNPEARQEYESLKAALAKQHKDDAQRYQKDKDTFIQKIDEKAAIDRLRMVIAFTDREWKHVEELRQLHFTTSGHEVPLKTEHHSHILLLQGTALIGYADVSIEHPPTAQLAMVVMKPGFEDKLEEFTSMLNRWLLHQGVRSKI